MKIITLNVGYGMCLPQLRDYIYDVAVNTDIFCLQEVDDGTKSNIEQIIGDTFRCYYDTKYVDQEKFLIATYIRKTIKIVSFDVMLKDVDTVGLAQRFVLMTQSGKLMALTNFHGYPRPGNKLDTTSRILQSHSLLDYVQRTDLATDIILGDFNLQPYTEALRIFLEAGYSNLIKTFNIVTTRNKIVWDKFPDDKQLFSDYVLIRSTKSTTSYAHDCDLNVPLDILMSDHQPIELVLNIQ